MGLKTVTEETGWFDAMAELAPDVTKQHQRSNFALFPSLDSSFDRVKGVKGVFEKQYAIADQLFLSLHLF